MTNGDGYDREGRDDEPYPYYRPPRPHLDPTPPAVGGTPSGKRVGAPPGDRFAAPPGASGGGKTAGKRKHMPLWQELPLLLVVAFCLAVLIRTFLLQAFYIPSGSMEDTLRISDRVLVNKVVYDMRQPARGEIVVFSGTESWAPENPPDPNIGFFARLGRTVGDLVGISRPGEKDFIKRIIGLPGDVVSCCDPNGRVYVNGYPLDEPYVIENAPLEGPSTGRDCRSRRFDPVTVEPGHMFVMGDHRLVSQDSRCQGQVPLENVIGRAFVIVWPSGHWAGLGVPETFQNVPKPFAAGLPERDPAPASPVDAVALVALVAAATRPGPARPVRRRAATETSPSARSGLLTRSSRRRLAP